MSSPGDDSIPQPPAEGPTAGGVPPTPSAPGALPVYSGASDIPPAASPVVAPATVTISFWLYILSATLSVVAGLVAITGIPDSRQLLLDQFARQDIDLQGQTVQQIVDVTIALGIAVAIVTMIFWALVFVLFAVFMRRGANWARIVLTVLTVLSLLNILAAYGLGSLQVLASVAAAVLLWLPASSRWFAAVKASKPLRT